MGDKLGERHETTEHVTAMRLKGQMELTKHGCVHHVKKFRITLGALSFLIDFSRNYVKDGSSF